MKKFVFLIGLVLVSQAALCQKRELKPVAIELDYFYGSILEHNSDIAHLITGHASGFNLVFNRKTYGHNEWESRYNYPDWGFTFNYQDLGNEYLGKNYGLYGHFNWYFWKRQLRLGIGQGVALRAILTTQKPITRTRLMAVVS